MISKALIEYLRSLTPLMKMFDSFCNIRLTLGYILDGVVHEVELRLPPIIKVRYVFDISKYAVKFCIICSFLS